MFKTILPIVHNARRVYAVVIFAPEVSQEVREILTFIEPLSLWDIFKKLNAKDHRTMVETFGIYWALNVFNRRYILNEIKKIMEFSSEEKTKFIEKLKLSELLLKVYNFEGLFNIGAAETKSDLTAFIYAWQQDNRDREVNRLTRVFRKRGESKKKVGGASPSVRGASQSVRGASPSVRGASTNNQLHKTGGDFLDFDIFDNLDAQRIDDADALLEEQEAKRGKKQKLTIPQITINLEDIQHGILTSLTQKYFVIGLPITPYTYIKSFPEYISSVLTLKYLGQVLPINYSKQNCYVYTEHVSVESVKRSEIPNVFAQKFLGDQLDIYPLSTQWLALTNQALYNDMNPLAEAFDEFARTQKESKEINKQSYFMNQGFSEESYFLQYKDLMHTIIDTHQDHVQFQETFVVNVAHEVQAIMHFKFLGNDEKSINQYINCFFPTFTSKNAILTFDDIKQRFAEHSQQLIIDTQSRVQVEKKHYDIFERIRSTVFGNIPMEDITIASPYAILQFTQSFAFSRKQLSKELQRKFKLHKHVFTILFNFFKLDDRVRELYLKQGQKIVKKTTQQSNYNLTNIKSNLMLKIEETRRGLKYKVVVFIHYKRTEFYIYFSGNNKATHDEIKTIVLELMLDIQQRIRAAFRASKVEFGFNIGKGKVISTDIIVEVKNNLIKKHLGIDLTAISTYNLIMQNIQLFFLYFNIVKRGNKQKILYQNVDNPMSVQILTKILIHFYKNSLMSFNEIINRINEIIEVDKKYLFSLLQTLQDQGALNPKDRQPQEYIKQSRFIKKLGVQVDTNVQPDNIRFHIYDIKTMTQYYRLSETFLTSLFYILYALVKTPKKALVEAPFISDADAVYALQKEKEANALQELFEQQKEKKLMISYQTEDTEDTRRFSTKVQGRSMKPTVNTTYASRRCQNSSTHIKKPTGYTMEELVQKGFKQDDTLGLLYFERKVKGQKELQKIYALPITQEGRLQDGEVKYFVCEQDGQFVYTGYIQQDANGMCYPCCYSRDQLAKDKNNKSYKNFMKCIKPDVADERGSGKNNDNHDSADAMDNIDDEHAVDDEHAMDDDNVISALAVHERVVRNLYIQQFSNIIHKDTYIHLPEKLIDFFNKNAKSNYLSLNKNSITQRATDYYVNASFQSFDLISCVLSIFQIDEATFTQRIKSLSKRAFASLQRGQMVYLFQTPERYAQYIIRERRKIEFKWIEELLRIPGFVTANGTELFVFSSAEDSGYKKFLNQIDFYLCTKTVFYLQRFHQRTYKDQDFVFMVRREHVYFPICKIQYQDSQVTQQFLFHIGSEFNIELNAKRQADVNEKSEDMKKKRGRVVKLNVLQGEEPNEEAQIEGVMDIYRKLHNNKLLFKYYAQTMYELLERRSSIVAQLQQSYIVQFIAYDVSDSQKSSLHKVNSVRKQSRRKKSKRGGQYHSTQDQRPPQDQQLGDVHGALTIAQGAITVAQGVLTIAQGATRGGSHANDNHRDVNIIRKDTLLLPVQSSPMMIFSIDDGQGVNIDSGIRDYDNKNYLTQYLKSEASHLDVVLANIITFNLQEPFLKIKVRDLYAVDWIVQKISVSYITNEDIIDYDDFVIPCKPHKINHKEQSTLTKHYTPQDKELKAYYEKLIVINESSKLEREKALKRREENEQEIEEVADVEDEQALYDTNEDQIELIELVKLQYAYVFFKNLNSETGEEMDEETRETRINTKNTSISDILAIVMGEQVLMKYKYYYYKLLVAKLVLPEIYDELRDNVVKILKVNIRVNTDIINTINKIRLRLTRLTKSIELGRNKPDYNALIRYACVKNPEEGIDLDLSYCYFAHPDKKGYQLGYVNITPELAVKAINIIAMKIYTDYNPYTKTIHLDYNLIKDPNIVLYGEGEFVVQNIQFIINELNRQKIKLKEKKKYLLPVPFDGNMVQAVQLFDTEDKFVSWLSYGLTNVFLKADDDIIAPLVRERQQFFYYKQFIDKKIVEALYQFANSADKIAEAHKLHFLNINSQSKVQELVYAFQERKLSLNVFDDYNLLLLVFGITAFVYKVNIQFSIYDNNKNAEYLRTFDKKEDMFYAVARRREGKDTRTQKNCISVTLSHPLSKGWVHLLLEKKKKVFQYINIYQKEATEIEFIQRLLA